MRARFQPPLGDQTDPAVIDRTIRAGLTDSTDREAVLGDYVYWRAEWPNLVARGVEIHVDHYAWLRLIGWQAGGTDIPPYGPYAVPPNGGPPGGWTTPLVDDPEAPDAPAPPLPLTPSPAQLLVDLQTSLTHLAEQVASLDASLRTAGHTATTALDRIEQRLTHLEQQLARMWRDRWTT